MRKLSYFLVLVSIGLIVTSCSSYKLSIRSVRHPVKVGKQAKVKLLKVKVASGFFSDSVARDFEKFFSFSLEKAGFILVKKADATTLTLSVGLRQRRILSGVDEKYSLAADIYLRWGDKKVLRLFSVYEGEQPVIASQILASVTDKIAQEIKEKIEE